MSGVKTILLSYIVDRMGGPRKDVDQQSHPQNNKKTKKITQLRT